MKTKFYAPNGCPVVTAIANGPSGSKFIEMLVDTGASYSSLNSKLLTELGIKIDDDKTILVSATAVVELKITAVSSIETLGVVKENMQVIVLDFPEGSVKVDGVLGVDFFENKKLNIDFRKHTIEVKA